GKETTATCNNDCRPPAIICEDGSTCMPGTCPENCIAKPACNNNVDDDFDGVIDLNDPGCKNNKDTSEQGTRACDNGKDDDNDGVKDYPTDTGCSGPTDTSERGTYLCDNGKDDDKNKKTDYKIDGTGDTKCTSITDNTEIKETTPTASCTDNIKNQDETDTDCGGTCPACQPTTTCGDNQCTTPENSETCPTDCPLTTPTEKIQLRYQFSCEEMHNWFRENKNKYKITFGNNNFACPGDVDETGKRKPLSREAKITAAFLLFEQIDSPQANRHIPGNQPLATFIRKTAINGFNIGQGGCEGAGAYYSNKGVYLCQQWFAESQSGGQDLGKDIFPYTTLMHEIGHSSGKHVTCTKGNRKGQPICDAILRNQPFAKTGGAVNFEFWFNILLQKYYTFPTQPDADGERNSKLITEGYLKEMFNNKQSTNPDYYLKLLD
ncbi:MAG: hypothetical protein Q7R96_01500, partial [Nanoarchaeota archaeon]|nr:hypothetical protein [Nanoarchaeota archaeon]